MAAKEPGGCVVTGWGHQVQGTALEPGETGAPLTEYEGGDADGGWVRG